MTSSVMSLWQLAGVSPEPARLSQSAVIIIDAQNDYRGRLPLSGIDAAARQVQSLLRRARRVSAPVIHVVHEGAPGNIFDRRAEGGAILPEATPEPGEAIVVKRWPSGFAGTSLRAELEALNRNKLVVAGFMTHMCVSTTVRAALELGFHSTLIADATATRSLPDPLTGGVVPAEVVQRAALAALADRFAVITPLDRLAD